MLDQMVSEQKEKSPTRNSNFQDKIKPKKSSKKSKPKSALKSKNQKSFVSTMNNQEVEEVMVYKNQALCSSPVNRKQPGRVGSPMKYRKG